jgi:hypothetical protein
MVDAQGVQRQTSITRGSKRVELGLKQTLQLLVLSLPLNHTVRGNRGWWSLPVGAFLR